MTEVPTADQPICGFDTVFGLCRDAREPGTVRCTLHGQVRFMVCVGCAGQAVRECREAYGPGSCGLPVCMSCQHSPSGSHGAPETAPPAAPRAQADRVENIRQQLTERMARSLQDSADRGLMTFPAPDYPTRVAAVVLDDLAAFALLGLLSGMAAQGGVQ